MRHDEARLVSCPRAAGVALTPIAEEEVTKRLDGVRAPISVVMGCVVNGPGVSGGPTLGVACEPGCVV